MVPTDVLANQHYKNIKDLLMNSKLEVVLITGKMKQKNMLDVHEKIISMMQNNNWNSFINFTKYEI